MNVSSAAVRHDGLAEVGAPGCCGARHVIQCYCGEAMAAHLAHGGSELRLSSTVGLPDRGRYSKIKLIGT